MGLAQECLNDDGAMSAGMAGGTTYQAKGTGCGGRNAITCGGDRNEDAPVNSCQGRFWTDECDETQQSPEDDDDDELSWIEKMLVVCMVSNLT